MIDQLATLNGAIFIQNNHGHMFHVIVEGVAKCNHFDQRWKKHEEKCHWVAPDHDEFLEENGPEPTKRFAFHIKGSGGFQLFGEHRLLACSCRQLASNDSTGWQPVLPR